MKPTAPSNRRSSTIQGTVRVLAGTLTALVASVRARVQNTVPIAARRIRWQPMMVVMSIPLTFLAWYAKGRAGHVDGRMGRSKRTPGRRHAWWTGGIRSAGGSGAYVAVRGWEGANVARARHRRAACVIWHHARGLGEAAALGSRQVYAAVAGRRIRPGLAAELRGCAAAQRLLQVPRPLHDVLLKFVELGPAALRLPLWRTESRWRGRMGRRVRQGRRNGSAVIRRVPGRRRTRRQHRRDENGNEDARRPSRWRR